MNETTPRIPALPVERLTAEQRELIGDWTKLNFSRVIVNHPAMYRTFVPFLAQLITRTELPPRDRELVCLRTLALCDDTYELHHHKTIARNTKMSEEEIAAACEGRGDCLSPFDLVVLRATEELVRDQFISDDTWQALSAEYNQVQLMDLVFLAGCYVTMGMITKSFGMELESEEDQVSINAGRAYN